MSNEVPSDLERERMRMMLFALVRRAEHASPKAGVPPSDLTIREHVDKWEQKVFSSTPNKYRSKFAAQRAHLEAHLTKLGATTESPRDVAATLFACVEDVRTRLRILNAIGLGKNGERSKQVFMAIFEEATKLALGIKAKTTPDAEAVAACARLGERLAQLQCQIDPRFRDFMAKLHIETKKEMFELDHHPFGFLDRLISVGGNVTCAKRGYRASLLVGGRVVLKRHRPDLEECT